MKLGKLTSNLYRKLFANRFCYKWNRWVLSCGLKGLGVNNFGDSISGELFLLKQLIASHPNPTLFDVGANVGCWSQMALSINPTARIFAFEPGNKPFAQLQLVDHIKAYHCACGAQSQEGILFDRSDQPNSTHASLDYEAVARLKTGVKQQPVQIVTLDEVIQKEKIERIDLLKIDVEGLEYEVLQGAQQALSNEIIQCIQFEFNEMNIYRRRFYRDFYDLLPSFDLFRLLPHGRIPLKRYDPMLHELFAYQNLLAVRKTPCS